MKVELRRDLLVEFDIGGRITCDFDMLPKA